MPPASADWSREALVPGRHEPGKRLVRCIRQHQRAQGRKLFFLKPLVIRYIVYRWRFWSAVCGADIPFMEHLGGGFAVPHPNGVVIHPLARIGVNCTVMQQVTIGKGTKGGYPTIGDNVFIGPGAKILGDVTVGDDAKVGANAVVLADVPPGATVTGIPAGP